MKDKHLQAFGAIVRKKREELKLSQEEFADLCEFHRTYIGGIERGERNIGLLSLIRLAAALQLPLSELFRELDQESE